MNAPLSIFLGYDSREHAAYEVADFSIRRRASVPVLITPLVLSQLGHLLTRPIERRGVQLYCPISQAPMSTEFAISRFCVPFLQREGWALFADCDVLAQADIAELFALADTRYAVQVVKHDYSAMDEHGIRPDGYLVHSECEACREIGRKADFVGLKPKGGDYHSLSAVTGTKMDGQAQIAYPRKNWSSVVLWNCAHPAHIPLTSEALNTWPGRDLHAFKWLADDEIGALPPEWNWLVGVSPPIDEVVMDVDGPMRILQRYSGVTGVDKVVLERGPKLLHFTLGGPWFPEWMGGPCDELWICERCDFMRARPQSPALGSPDAPVDAAS